MANSQKTKLISQEIKDLINAFSDSRELQEAIIIFLLKEKKVLTDKELLDYFSELHHYIDFSIAIMQLIDEGKVGVKNGGYIHVSKKNKKIVNGNISIGEK